MSMTQSDDIQPWAHNWLMPFDNDDVEPMIEETTLILLLLTLVI